MTRPLLIGEVAEKDRMLCLRTGANVWYPLGGMSGIALKFREAFGRPQQCDIGKRVYNNAGVLQMENAKQLAARIARENEQ